MARQKLGQHFLVSSKALELIARSACGDGVPLAVEIGPGKGALTEHLLLRAEHVVAIELDPELSRHLKGRWFKDPRIEILEANALHVNWSSWGVGVLVGNLPYYVASAIISRYIRTPGELSHGVFLIQKEVAERITSQPGNRDYGYFSVECQFLAATEYIHTVAPGAFRPPPRVESAVVRLTPRTHPANAAGAISVEPFLKFVSVCFRQKRKTLRNNLATLFPRDVLAELPGLDRRAEELSVAEFVQLNQSLAALRELGREPEPDS